MKVSIQIGAPDSGKRNDFEQLVEFVVEAERLGVDCIWSAEAWGMDSVAPLAWIGARTKTIRLGTGIMQISARAPVMTAMTALTMAAISGNRFILGLGASGPQVVEGLHGTPFKAPLTRLRETVDILRLAFAGEKIEYHGRYHELPLPGGQGKALRLAQPPNPNIPIFFATLSPKALELTGEIADGWLGTCFTPEGAEAHVAPLRAGAERAGRSLDDLTLAAGGSVGFGDIEELANPIKAGMAFQVGAMGSPTTNFYANSFCRGGWEDEVREVQSLWVAGKREEATARFPVELVRRTHLIGSDEEVRARIEAYRNAGISLLNVNLLGTNMTEQLETLRRLMGLLS